MVVSAARTTEAPTELEQGVAWSLRVGLSEKWLLA